MRFILLMGLPGSGKSTYIEKYLSNYPIVCPDVFLMKKGEYIWTPGRAAKAWQEAQQIFGYNLLQRETFVFDATFVEKRTRALYLNIAKGAGYHTEIIYMKVSLEEAIERNSKRQPVSKRIPEATIRNMFSRLEEPSSIEAKKITVNREELWKEIIS